uniref:Rabenosyn-5 n=1 Tax=Phallusia mammillata TaxID=59560 RepID=A0A6F9DWZ8_9ASCI|nr:rabenosyn-5 [Phallusia mammillata]
MDEDIREGFLCPICVKDLGSFHKLQHHFESAHTAEDKAVFDQVKGLFTKAKGKILGRNEIAQIPDESYTTSSHQEQTIWEPQEIGITKSHFDTYKKVRDSRIDRFVIESNKVLIRLDKLMGHSKLTGKQNSKEFEQTLVPWVRDGDVPFCPTCGDRFYVTRRRHHCRLCGSIMCTKCSLFVPYDFADELVETLRESTSSMPRQRSRSLLVLPQSSSDNDMTVRCCHDCYRILRKRKDKIEQKYNQPLLVAFYEKLQTAKTTAEKLAPKYKEMATSLNQGEETFELGKANDLRLKLMKLYEVIDVVSKKIAAMDTENEENPPPGICLQLQSSIRRASHMYLQENMLTLQSLPSLPKLELLQKERRKEQERRVRRQREEAERERAEAKRLQELEKIKQERELAERDKMETSSFKRHQRQVSDISLNGIVLREGWTADNGIEKDVLQNHQHKNDEPDPLMEQIQHVQKMLHQAANAGQAEAVKTLTLNLEELKTEYKKQQSIKAFGGGVSNRGKTHSPNLGHSIQVNKNPFLDKKLPVRKSTPRPTSVKVAKSPNPFLEDEDSSSNPFLEDDDDSLNPFLSSPVQDAETNPFLTSNNYSPVSENETHQDPVFHQICYISKCLDNAVKSGKQDEAAILRQNLQELQSLYNKSR